MIFTVKDNTESCPICYGPFNHCTESSKKRLLVLLSLYLQLCKSCYQEPLFASLVPNCCFFLLPICPPSSTSFTFFHPEHCSEHISSCLPPWVHQRQRETLQLAPLLGKPNLQLSNSHRVISPEPKPSLSIEKTICTHTRSSPKCRCF